MLREGFREVENASPAVVADTLASRRSSDEDDGKGHPRLILQLSCVSTWLYVTELEDARDSIELLNFDDKSWILPHRNSADIRF